jgi:hypothetical protein
MLVELPHSQPELVEDRLSALEDRSLADLLIRENPELYTRAIEFQERDAIGRRFSNAALVLLGVASVVAGYVLAPNAFKQPAAHPVAQPPAAVAHRPAPARVRHPAVAVHRPTPVAIAAPVRHTDAVVAKLQARIAAHEAVARAASRRVAAIAAAPKALAHPRPENAPQTQPAAASATTVSTAAGSATANQAAMNAPMDPRLLIDAPAPPDGTKAAPPAAVSGHWAPQANPAGQADPCTPHGGRTGIIMQSLGRSL